MEVIKSPQDNIEAYLKDGVNINIFNSLIDFHDYTEINTLGFFNLLYREFNFFNENKENYLIIKNYFKEYQNEYNNEVSFFENILILECLEQLIDLYYFENTNTVILKSCDFIKILVRQNLPKQSIKKRFNFNFTKKYLNSLTTTEKIKYLIEVKTECNQEIDFLDYDSNDFVKKCELEIDKLTEFLKLENTIQQPPTEPVPNNSLNWQGTPLQFTELTKALFETKLISPGLTQKEFFNRMKLFFNVNELDEGEKLGDIRKRTTTTTPLLNILEKSLNNWIKNKD